MKECNDVDISLSNEDVISDECIERDEFSSTFNGLLNDDEQYVHAEKLCVLQRSDEQLKVIFNEINALSNGQVDYIPKIILFIQMDC